MLSKLEAIEGYTILEVVAAVLILAFGILALSRTQIGAISGNSFAQELTEATKLAQRRMEILMSLPYDAAGCNDTNVDCDENDSSCDVPNCLHDRNGNSAGQDSDSNGVDDDDEGNSADGIPGFGLNQTRDSSGTLLADYSIRDGKYTIFWNVALEQPVPDNKIIRVLVQWNDKKNVLHTVTMDSVKGTTY